METPTFNMVIEKPVGVLKPRGFHLGTDLAIAESFVFEQLRNGAVSVALRLGNSKPSIYDFRDLPERSEEA